MNFIEIEFTQWRVFFSVRCSFSNTWPRCAPHFLHKISVRIPSASGFRSTFPGISSSKEGHPQSDLNLLSDLYNGSPHCLQIYVPLSKLSLYSPVKGDSVPL